MPPAFPDLEPAKHRGQVTNKLSSAKSCCLWILKAQTSYFTSIYSAEFRLAEYKNNTAVHIKQYFPRQKATQDTKPDQQSLTIQKCACQQ